MLEEVGPRSAGPRYQHQADRAPFSVGKVPSEVVLSGQKVAVLRPRVRPGTEGIGALPVRGDLNPPWSGRCVGVITLPYA